MSIDRFRLLKGAVVAVVLVATLLGRFWFIFGD